jgi:branched-chain amino acid transport system substrate-binding protein
VSFARRQILEIASLLGIEPRFAGAGLAFDLGALYPQTGSGALYDDRIGDVPNLACRHVEAMGGPKFNLLIRDHRTGDARAGAGAIAEFAAAKVPMMLSSYSANLGTLLPDIERYGIFTIDGGGGAPLYAQGKPYFWGSIATTPNDALAGVIAFVQNAMPEVATYGTIGWEMGALDAAIARDAARYFREAGLTRTVAEKTKIGATEYSAPLHAIHASGCDLVFCFLYGEDVGYFMKQYAASGIGKPVIAFTHSQSAQRIAGPAYEGLYFAFDYFDPEQPANPWAKFYLDEFRDLEGPDFTPDNYGANTYEDIFALWACVRRVLEKGGDPHSGPQLDAALRDDPSFPSLYGGNARSAGTLRFDLSTHSVERRPMTIARVDEGKIVPRAYFESGSSALEPASPAGRPGGFLKAAGAPRAP